MKFNLRLAVERAQHLYLEQNGTRIKKQDIAAALGTTPQNLNTRLNTASPLLSTIERISSALEVSPWRLVELGYMSSGDENNKGDTK